MSNSRIPDRDIRETLPLTAGTHGKKGNCDTSEGLSELAICYAYI